MVNFCIKIHYLFGKHLKNNATLNIGIFKIHFSGSSIFYYEGNFFLNICLFVVGHFLFAYNLNNYMFSSYISSGNNIYV